MTHDFSNRYPASENPLSSQGKAPPPPGALELLQVLQGTLNLEELLGLLKRELHTQVPLDGLRYQLADQNIDLQQGHCRDHSANYHLTIEEGHSLGEITFFRARSFQNSELQVLENLLAALLYPLRNSLEYQRVLRLALIDPLTGANNRASMDMALKREVELSRRKQTPLTVILLDIDYFKKVNDSYGHSAGDLCLQAVAGCVQDSIRGSDLLFRCGGEEFLVLLSQTDMTGASQLAERIRSHVADLALNAIGNHRLTVSAGVSALTGDDSVKSLYDRCDRALYQAKRQGRNRVEVL
jgi:diguanylate cyclase (GGDEF)-like protein